MSEKWVYSFSRNEADGAAESRALLGGKGASLAEMCRIGLPVPPGFTITTEVCGYYYSNEKRLPRTLESQVAGAMRQVENLSSSRFGGADKPLLVSVRSGGRASMPGMMDTVLNLGLGDETVLALGESTGDMRFAYDCYRRFIQMYANVVMGVAHILFEEALHRARKNAGAGEDADLGAEHLLLLIGEYQRIVERETGSAFPQNAQQQLWGAIRAVLDSWQSRRAVIYRRLHGIPGQWGTAVNIQAMVFGNKGDDCATGVAFTRNPSSGENEFYGEYLINAQGEDVVAGIRTPGLLTEAAKNQLGSSMESMEKAMPKVFAELADARKTLETHYQDMQDIEFTVEGGVLYILQTRDAKRTAGAALKVACDMVAEGLISKRQAIKRIDPQSLERLLHPVLDPKAGKTIIGNGLPASPGAVSGQIVFTPARAVEWAAEGRKVILVRTETSPEDIHGIHAAEGILTTRGGMTSHAAVVARGMGAPCVTGAGAVEVDTKGGFLIARGHKLHEGDWLSIDGSSGEIILGRAPTARAVLGEDFSTLMGWADEARRLRVRANAETPEDVKTALRFGAEGIGLCRTEHMFFGAERIGAMQQMILADDEQGRRRALARILPMQRRDFERIFTLMDGKAVTIRLLDPPLHEFLPHKKKEFAEVARRSGVSVERLMARGCALAEVNPMLGHRGCRLLISYPEICEMQARAIFEAAIAVEGETGRTPLCEIMVPLICLPMELGQLKAVIAKTAERVQEESGRPVSYRLGTMIELPRACLQAAEIADLAEFFSFGTNDLTQTTYGFSRDDAAATLTEYRTRNILDADPFATLDVSGVGELIRIAVERGREARPDIKLGICGEHGGDPLSVHFCESLGLDYVSCSPFRVPVARLAAAQAALSSPYTGD